MVVPISSSSKTVMDTLNCKAALFAIQTLAEARGIDIPLIVSSDRSGGGGRNLSGQTVRSLLELGSARESARGRVELWLRRTTDSSVSRRNG